MASRTERGRGRGRFLSWAGGVLLLAGGLAACQGGLSETGCGDKSTGYEQCMDDAHSTRTAGGVFVVLGLGLLVYGAVENRRG